MSGFAMLAIFAVAAGLMYVRLLPALLAVPLMALGIALVAGAGWPGLSSTIVDGSARLAPVIVTVIFGALLSRVTLATGIAETIVTYAAEFGGDRPAVLALALCAAVAILFTSLTGLGAIIMVGSIVLPIMLTIGVPRKTAATLFMLAFALGFIFNIAQWTFYLKTFGVERIQMQPFAYVLATLDLCALVAFASVRFRATRGYATWALASDPPVRKRAPLYACLTPVLPIAFYFVFHMEAIVAFSFAALYGVLSTAPRRAVPTLVAAAIRGVEDVAPAIVLFMGIGMLLVATSLPSVKAALGPLVAAVAPRSWLGYVVLFGLFSPLALYRGPLNPFGVGIAVYTVLAGLGILPAVTLVAAVMAVVQVQNVCDPTNTQNVWVANFTGVGVNEITRLTLPFQVAVATAATLAVVLFGSVLLGTQPFSPATPAGAAESVATAPAAAETVTARAGAAAILASPQSAARIVATPASTVQDNSDALRTRVPVGQAGLLAPVTARRTIAIETGDGAEAGVASHQVFRAIAGGWTGFKAIAFAGDASLTDCAAKPFTAVARITVTDADVGLELSDCAGWPVEQWYVPRGADVRAAALAALFRLRTWSAAEPRLATSLFDDGLAYDAARAKPTYFYSLYKTADGQMRAYVRPGGPAYAAGLRTNDIVVKLDGKFWWEYGTFQTQARAYDGLPHTFDIARGNVADVTTVTASVALGRPFALLDAPSSAAFPSSPATPAAHASPVPPA